MRDLKLTTRSYAPYFNIVSISVDFILTARFVAYGGTENLTGNNPDSKNLTANVLPDGWAQI